MMLWLLCLGLFYFEKNPKLAGSGKYSFKTCRMRHGKRDWNSLQFMVFRERNEEEAFTVRKDIKDTG